MQVAGNPRRRLISLSTSLLVTIFHVSCGEFRTLCFALTLNPKRARETSSSPHICSLNEICHRARRACAGHRAVVLICQRGVRNIANQGVSHDVFLPGRRMSICLRRGLHPVVSAHIEIPRPCCSLLSIRHWILLCILRCSCLHDLS